MNRSKSEATRSIDIVNGGLWKNILMFAIPLAVSSVLQQLFNSVDVAVVGKFATSQDQAAVGCTGALINLMINLFVGISVGANVVISNYLGSKKDDKVKSAVHTSIVIALVSGIFLLVIGIIVARPVLVLMDTPADTLDLAVDYMKIYFLGMPFIMLYNFGAAILRSIGDTKRPLYCLTVAGVLNAALNLFLVIVFHLGVTGVAIATVISNIVSSLMITYILIHENEPVKLSVKKLGISKQDLSKILKIGVPAGIQGMVFSFANVFIQAALNGFGSDVVAGSAVALNYEFIIYFIVSAFSQTAVTFVSTNFGAGNYDRVKKVFRICMIYSVVISQVLGIIVALNGFFFASIFTSKAAVAGYAVTRMRLLLFFYLLVSSYEIGGAALRGMGHSMTPAALTVFGTCVLRLVWIYTVFVKYHSYDVLLIVYPVSWIITGVAVLAAYVYVSKKECKI